MTNCLIKREIGVIQEAGVNMIRHLLDLEPGLIK